MSRGFFHYLSPLNFVLGVLEKKILPGEKKKKKKKQFQTYKRLTLPHLEKKSPNENMW